MTDMVDHDAELRVGAHVLVQLGSELVTDVEHAILECVKNAYDADAPGCRIDIDTREVGSQSEVGSVDRFWGFDKPAETVTVELLDRDGQPLKAKPDAGGADITRKLNYTGRITIEDKGDGLDPEQLRSSWLVISGSNKRGAAGGQKAKTKKGRTPLGDKGLGRPGFAGGPHSQVGWSHDKPDDERILPRGPRAGGADHESEPPSRWAAISSIAGKIGCSPHTLLEWLKKADRDSGRAPGVPSDIAAKLKALERENRELRQANEILRKASAYFAQAELDRRFKP